MFYNQIHRARQGREDELIPNEKEREREREGRTETDTQRQRKRDKKEKPRERQRDQQTVKQYQQKGDGCPDYSLQKMHFQHFYQSDATYVRTLIFKDRKKCKKVDSKSIVNRPIQFPNKHRACFFRILKNRCVKRPRLLSTCPPPIAQILQSVLECAHGCKKRFAQKS